MGDHTAGAEASQSVIDSIEMTLKLNQHLFPSWTDDELARFLTDTLKTANLNLIDTNPNSGATVTLAFVGETTAVIAHVGECRAYLINGRDGSCTQLTVDHILMTPLLYLTPLMPQENIDLTPRPILYRALGQAEDLDVDLSYKQLEVGDSLLLCSKGLYRHVNDEEIAAIISDEENLDAVTQKLIDLANERGGEDNISVIVMRIAHEDAVSNADE